MRPKRSDSPPPHVEKRRLHGVRERPEDGQPCGCDPDLLRLEEEERVGRRGEREQREHAGCAPEDRGKRRGREKKRRRKKEDSLNGEEGGGEPRSASCGASPAPAVFTFKEIFSSLFSFPSFTPRARTSSDSAAGTAASEKTVLRLRPIEPDQSRREQGAEDGARVVEGAVEAECRAAAVRRRGGSRSSRRAARCARPCRSGRRSGSGGRAASPARGRSGGGRRTRGRSRGRRAASSPSRGRSTAREDLHERGRRVRDAFDQPERRRGRARQRREETRAAAGRSSRTRRPSGTTPSRGGRRSSAARSGSAGENRRAWRSSRPRPSF